MTVADRNLLGSTLTPTGLNIPVDMTAEDWTELGAHLGAVRDATAWGIADWLIFGERAFGEDQVAQAVERTGRSKATLLKYRWIGEHIAPHRRRSGLSFTHHEIVARLPLEIADGWLDEAEREGWSVEEFRGRVRPDKPQEQTVETLYVSGPMTGLEEFNYPAFHAAKDSLARAGFAVISPADLPIRDDWDWIDYILVDIDAVFSADGIATLDGWELSKGARIECRIAAQRGIPVRPVVEWLGDAG